MTHEGVIGGKGILDIRTSRRHLPRVATLGVVAGLQLAGARFALDTPYRPIPPEKISRDGNELAGFLELQIQSPFFTIGGHKDFLSEALQIPLVHETAVEIFKRVVNGKPQLLGEALIRGIEIAMVHLQKNYPGLSRKALDIEAVHMGTLILAGTFSKFWNSWEEMEKLFAFKMPDTGGTVENFFWKQGEGIAHTKFPQTFGAGDKAIHVANHMFLVFESLYSKHYNLGIHKEIPRFVQVYIRLTGPNDTAALRDERFSDAVGKLYELRTTFTPEGMKFWDKKNIAVGLLDQDVRADIKANTLGARLGVVLATVMGESGSWKNVRRTLLKLNESYWTEKSASPIFPPRAKGTE